MKKQKNLQAAIALNVALLTLATSAFGQYEGVYGYGIELNGTGSLIAQ